jgi:CBS domain-containing protein
MSDRHVAEMMHADVLIVHHDHSLAEAQTRLAESEAPACVVVDGDRVVRVLSRSALTGLVEDLGEDAHLRDGVAARVHFCFEDEPLAVAAATLRANGSDVLAVVDRDHRIVGVLPAAAIAGVPADAAARPPVDPSDRSDEEHPRLEVYAPWAVVER